ncbi:MAG: ABC transporter permease [Pseudomonadota bacterium]|nr:ABC transporter permease [Pseudomonadota bacterium]
MPSTTPSRHRAATFVERFATTLLSWWSVVYFSAELLALALSPSSYRRRYRPALARHIYLDTAPHLGWFTLLSALISLVLIRIVVVTAESYGLSQFTIQMVVRVLVLELIPTTAALFVALRSTIPRGAELAEMRRASAPAVPVQRRDLVHGEVLPRVVGGIFAVWTLVAVSCVVALLVAYVVVYGFAVGGFATYTRTVGQVFSADVTLIFTLKTLFLSLAVALIPMAWAWRGSGFAGSATGRELQVLVRLFVMILLIEVASLMGNYY